MRRPLAALAFAASVAALAAADSPKLISESRPEKPGKKFSVRDAFVVKDIPPGTKKVRAWFELPQEEALQNISNLKITAPEGYRVTTEAAEGNRFLYVEIADPKAATFEVTVEFDLERWESQPPSGAARALTADERKVLEAQLEEKPNVEATDRIRAKAAEVTKGVDDPVAKARKFYDFIIDNAEYWKKDPDHLKPSGKGSATYCMDSKTGNCTDFHALFMAMARTADLPTQFVMGTPLKAELDGVTKFDEKLKEPGYHCWIRTYFAGRGWVYSDISYADLNEAKRDYYFDHIDDNRVTFSFGRNIELAPKQDGARVNFFSKCYVEADGKEHTAWTRELTYRSAN